MVCKSCGAEMKEHAKYCENCGAPVQAREAETKPQKKKRSMLKTAGTILLVIILAIAFIRSLNSDNDILGIDNMREAYKLAQEVVLNADLLYNTANVTFPEFEADYVTQRPEPLTYDGEEYQVYTVSSYVDHENLFGATLRSDYVIKIGLPTSGDSDLYYYEVVSFD